MLCVAYIHEIQPLHTRLDNARREWLALAWQKLNRDGFSLQAVERPQTMFSHVEFNSLLDGSRGYVRFDAACARAIQVAGRDLGPVDLAEASQDAPSTEGRRYCTCESAPSQLQSAF